MATIKRYVVKISHSSIPFTAKSLNMDGSDDPFARYQVNELYISSAGKGKTLLLNVDQVAKDFMVPSPYLVAYLGYSLGVKPNYDSKKPEKTRAFLSSSVDAEKLSQKMVNFTKEFVLCPKCKLPEITHTIDRKVGVVWVDCRSCDAHVTLQLQDKFQRYINSHPLPFPGAKEENAVRKKQEAAENAALYVERKK
jgi:translation initiation factor 2 beta subunit (eIF-2beta)/eIF-5